ncbi:MAG: class I SAM-dependent methyltransferase [Candidatus Aminicenantales bacterium]
MSENDWDQIYKDHPLEEIPWHSGQPDRRLVKLIKQNRIQKGSALDLCSGDGTNSLYLASKGFRVTGVDISPTAVEIARARAARRKLSCDYHVGSVLEFPYSQTYDFIFDRGCFHHIPKKRKPDYVRLVHRLLNPGGKFYLLCFSDKNPPFEKNLTEQDIRQHFEGHFEIHFIKDSVHREGPYGRKRYLYAVFMEKKGLR